MNDITFLTTHVSNQTIAIRFLKLGICNINSDLTKTTIEVFD